MPFSYDTNTQTIVDLLKAHNTTTATPDLSESLGRRVKNILGNDPGVFNARVDQLPAIYCWPVSADEEYAGIGSTGPSGARKEKVVNYNLLGVYYREGLTNKHSDALVEIYKLAENIEGVFQQEMDLSGTALFVRTVSTDFAPSGEFEGVIAKGVLVNLQVLYHFR